MRDQRQASRIAAGVLQEALQQSFDKVPATATRRFGDGAKQVRARQWRQRFLGLGQHGPKPFMLEAAVVETGVDGDENCDRPSFVGSSR